MEIKSVTPQPVTLLEQLALLNKESAANMTVSAPFQDILDEREIFPMDIYPMSPIVTTTTKLSPLHPETVEQQPSPPPLFQLPPPAAQFVEAKRPEPLSNPPSGNNKLTRSPPFFANLTGQKLHIDWNNFKGLKYVFP